MKFIQDPRIKIARKSLLVSWIFFSVFVFLVLFLSYSLGQKPYVFGLPQWVAIGAVLVPAVFTILVIFIAEKLIPDISLTDEEQSIEGTTDENMEKNQLLFLLYCEIYRNKQRLGCFSFWCYVYFLDLCWSLIDSIIIDISDALSLFIEDVSILDGVRLEMWWDIPQIFIFILFGHGFYFVFRV